MLEPGGRYRPSGCTARHRVAIIIPFRDRDIHLKLFLNNIHAMLQRQQLDYAIYVVDLERNIPFNRALLLNAGYLEAKKTYDYQCYVFHDVDLIPENDHNLYSCPEHPRHMSVAIDKWNYKLPYMSIFGGVVAMSEEQIQQVNGFSNIFFGWGGEDDDMFQRWFNAQIYSEFMIKLRRFNLLETASQRSKYDGINSLRYKVLKKNYNKLYTYILISVNQTEIMLDKDFVWIVMNIKKFTDFMKAGNPFDVLPWMRFILPKKYRLFCEILENGKAALDKKMKNIKQTYSKNDLRHTFDALITSTYEISEEEKLRVGLTDNLILAIAGDLIGAGFDTTATTLRWGLLLLASNPNVQEKAQREVDEVLGYGRRPSLTDKSRLPFTEAITLEVLRMGSTAPLSVPHSALEDTEIYGYTIPKDTVILFNLYSSNFDEQLWDSPYRFKPGRFLDRKGEIMREKAESVVSFGVGRRRCIGESVARMNIFMLLSSLLQRCKIIKPPEEEYDFKGKLTLTYAPAPFKVKIEARG
ncbi:hypothetical protein FSP39_012812 [Pinctada imbricata]|uniref:Uncharacterized protein n=1 Tax=Pinctada imbricata TaxID=66713 RepID=A0AA89C0Q5_PINIB|nr:hypothetical protein FSP39_012812 [Pinctada imbricata]